MGFYFILAFIAIWLLYAIISKICDTVTGKAVKSLLSSKELSWQLSLEEKEIKIKELNCEISDLHNHLDSQKHHYEKLLQSKQASIRAEHLKRSMKAPQEEQENIRKFEAIQAEAEALRAVYPEFDLDAEDHEQFWSLLVSLQRAGVASPLRTAYEVAHMDEIMERAVKYTAEKVRQDVNQFYDRQKQEILSSVSDRVKHETIALAHDISHRSYLQSTLAFQSIQNADGDTCSRLCRVLNNSMQIEPPFDISCTIHSESGNSYQTTLNHCSCADFSHRSKPCKHMYRLALEVGLSLCLQDVPFPLEQKIKFLSSDIASLEAEYDNLRYRNKEYSQKLRQKDKLLTEKEHELEQRKNCLSSLQSETLQTFPWLAAYYTDFQQAIDEKLIHHLRTKSRPAYTKAYEIEKIVRGELRECRLKAKEEEYQRIFYETMFPWLLEFKESSPFEAAEYVSLSESADDDEKSFIRAGYLTHKEWSSLSDAERNQLALERYIKSDKSPWQVGVEYERYIGWLCEQKGYHVIYNGAVSGYTDMGRDLIATKGKTVVIIQCKRWAKEKTIHEKHIFQLAGSVFEYRYKHPDKEVIGAFVTTIKLSPVATECGNLLGLKLYPETAFNDYPRIKCNIGKDNNKIYHLPMDQQYDSVKIDKDGEFYAHTVAEAEAAGFRRAYRWHSA